MMWKSMLAQPSLPVLTAGLPSLALTHALTLTPTPPALQVRVLFPPEAEKAPEIMSVREAIRRVGIGMAREGEGRREGGRELRRRKGAGAQEREESE